MILTMLKMSVAKEVPVTAEGVAEVKEDLSCWEVSCLQSFFLHFCFDFAV